MSWKNDLPRKVMAEDRDVRGAPCYLLGKVVSPLADGSGPLIISALDGNVMLTEEMVDRLCRTSHLREGMTVALLRGKDALIGGKRFFVQEIPGHGDLPGRDGADCHSIGAITGLRGELDEHDSRLDGHETRIGALETGKADKGHTHPISEVEGLQEALDDLTPGGGGGGEANVIEIVKRNGIALPVSGKAVDVTVPTKTSDLTNDSGFQNAQQVQAAAEEAVSGVLSEVSLFDLTPEVFPVEQRGISINTGSNLRTADLIRNYISSEGHNLGGSTYRGLCLTSGRVTLSTTSSSFVLYKSDFKTIPPPATTAKLLLTIRRYRADVGASDASPQIYAATYDADGKIWWANIGATVLGYYRQRYVVDPQVFSNGNLCIFVQFRKPTHTLKATFDLDVVAGDALIDGATNFTALTDSGETVQEQT